MVEKKFMFILGVLVLALSLIGVASATGQCTVQNYDSGNKLVKNYVVSVSGDAHTWEGNWYVDSSTGRIMVKTPNLPFDGEYNFTFNYFIGTANDPDTEDFQVTCGGKTYEFQDDILGDNPSWREITIPCDFNEGVNYVTFKSINTGSVHFDTFSVEGESECENPEEPVCGNNILEKGEQCDFQGIQCHVEGPHTSCTICNQNTCEIEKQYEHTCGNSILEEGEQCDDGNLIEGDGCNSQCFDEDNPEEPKEIRSNINVLGFNECVPNWQCSGWTECDEGVMTRTCYDQYNCEFEYNKPIESTSCVGSVVENVKVKNNSNLAIWFLIGVIVLVILIIILVNLLA